METLFSILLTAHIIVGTLSLIVFWIPVFVKKGGDIHNKIGKIYVIIMWMVVLSAFGLSILNVFRGRLIMAGFLGFLALITAQPLWYGIVILKHKNSISVKVRKIKLILNYSIFITGFGLVIWSFLLKIQGQSILLLIFGILGVVSTFGSIFKKKEVNQSWLAEHIGGMVGTGIAAYTAFFAFGASTLMGGVFSGYLVAIPWMLPTLIGTILIKRMKRKYGLSKKKSIQTAEVLQLAKLE